jgi:hypothetical protein
MILLGMTDNDIIQLLDAELGQVFEQHRLHRRVHGVDQGGFFAALNQV